MAIQLGFFNTRGTRTHVGFQFTNSQNPSRKPSFIPGVTQPTRPGNVVTSLASTAQSSAAVSMYPSAGASGGSGGFM